MPSKFLRSLGLLILFCAAAAAWLFAPSADEAAGQTPGGQSTSKTAAKSPEPKTYGAKTPDAKLPPDADFKDELPRIAPREPAEAMKSFQLLPGFRLEQVAAEPLVADPVAASFDERGRMFVACFRGYSENRDELLGEIRVLVDTDGDGRFDKSTLLADKLGWPTAVVCYDGGVYVGNAPDLIYLKDTDGDGRADIRRTVYTGFGTSNVQGLFNSFRWGLDNRIHGAGSSVGGNVQLVGPMDKPPAKQTAVTINGRDFSFDPRSHQLEATSGGCQHGMCFDEWGRKFVCSNSSHIELVMFEDRYLRRNRYLAAPAARQAIATDGGQAEVFRISPVEPWRIVRTRLRVSGQVQGIVEGGGRAAGYFTSATGVTIYTGNAWPAEFRGLAIVGDVGSNIVHRKRLQPDGVSLKAVRMDDKKEFLASSDIWFRPVQFANAPDGTLHILDMYREVIEHPLSLPPVIKKHLDLTSGRDRGRIYRIVPEGFKQPPLPRLDKASPSELAATLDHPNTWHRETAARLLFERQDAAAVEPLRKLAASGATPQGRMHALYALDGLGRLDDDVLLVALRDAHPRVREHAVRLAERFAAESSKLREAVLPLVNDPDALVRYQLAFSLGELSAAGRNEAIATLARRDGGDSWFRTALLSSLASGAGELLEQLANDKSFRATAAGRQMLGALAQQIGLAKRTDEVADVLKAVAALSQHDPALTAVIVRELGQGLNKSGSELRGLLASAGGATGKVFDDLLLTARKSAGDAKQPPAARAEAIRTLGLGTFASERELLAKLLDHREPREVQEAALAALARFADRDVGGVVLKAWNGFSPTLRAQATEMLFARSERLAALLDSVEQGEFRATDLESARIEFLRKHSDPKLRQRAGMLLSEVKLRRRQDVIAAYMPALKLTGDAARGKKHFEKNCSKCHRVEGIGYELAPNLAAMKNRGAEAILVNVLDPNREVNPQYVNYLALTEDGRSLTGLIAAETATSVTLKRGDNQSDTVLRVDITALQSTGLSIMPEGLEKELDQQALADLLAFLMSAK